MQTFKKSLLFIFSFLFFLSSFADSPNAKSVFKLKMSAGSNKIELHWDIQPGYFLYKDRIKISGYPNISMPAAVKHRDRMGNMHDIYRHQLHLSIPFHETTKVKITYQGCSDKGICFPPQTQKQTFVYQAQKPFIWILLSFLGLGALLAFTPCVLPMLPVMTKVVLGQQQHSKKQIWGLAIAYVLGMSLSYALVGAVLSQVGKNLFMLMQNPKMTLGMAVVYTYFGLATLEWVKIRLPQNLQSKTLQFRSHLQSGRYGSALLMGSLSLLVLSPCVTAPLLGALAYITQLGEVWKGTLALFTLGLGMGLPLMIFAVSAGHLLPKAGRWMENIKLLLALLLFSVAALLVQRTLSFPYKDVPWIAVMLIAAYLIRPQGHLGMAKNIRLILIFAVLLESLWVCYGLINPQYLPWPFQKPQNPTHEMHMQHELQMDNVFAKTQKPVILYFTAQWCATCQYLEKNVWSNQALQPLFQNYKIIKIDLTHNNQNTQNIMHQFEVVAPPTVIRVKSMHDKNMLRLSGEEITVEHLQKWIQ